jgi:hypothetical protein
LNGWLGVLQGEDKVIETMDLKFIDEVLHILGFIPQGWSDTEELYRKAIDQLMKNRETIIKHERLVDGIKTVKEILQNA